MTLIGGKTALTIHIASAILLAVLFEAIETYNKRL